MLKAHLSKTRVFTVVMPETTRALAKQINLEAPDSPYRHVHRTDGGGTLSGEKYQPIKIDFQPKILSPSTYQIFPIKIIAPYRCSMSN